MKSMTCKELGGGCDMRFSASTFEEIARMSKEHGREMFQKGDKAHLQAMDEMKALMQSPEAMAQWFEAKKREFERLPSSA
jgi:predicted small metal-binding protein